MKMLKSLWWDDRGQATTEYILMLAVVVMVALKFKSTFSGRITTLVNHLGDTLETGVAEGSRSAGDGG